MSETKRMTPADVERAFLTPMSDDRDAVWEMRRCIVEDAKLCSHAEAQSVPLADLFLLYAEYQREEASR